MNPVNKIPIANKRPENLAGETKTLSKSRIEHQQQVLWQIGIPIGFGGLAVLALLVIAIFSTFSINPGGIDRWRDISLIFMILPTLLAGLVFLALFVGLIYLIARFLRVLPKFTQHGQVFMDALSFQVKKWADRFVNPILSIHGFLAGFHALWRRLF